MQHSEEKLLEMSTKIDKIFAKATSTKQLGNDQEYENLVIAAVKLMTKYNLTYDQVYSEAQRKSDIQYSDPITLKRGSYGTGWQTILMAMISRHFYCTAFKMPDIDDTCTVAGHAHNIDRVIWMFNFISTQLVELTDADYKKFVDRHKVNTVGAKLSRVQTVSKHAYGKSFIIGALDTISSRLNKAMQSDDVHHAMIQRNYQAIDQFVSETANLTKGRSPSMNIPSMEAAQKGLQAGNDITLGDFAIDNK